MFVEIQSRPVICSIALASIFFAFAIAVQSFAQNNNPGAAELRWYKGNTHAHTINSDGDSDPADVVKWYRNNKYNFLFVTDHEFITDAHELNSRFAVPGEFLVIHGQEVTGSFSKKPYHLNGLGLTSVIRPVKAESAVRTLQQHIDAVRAAGAVPQINHPNFGWALTAGDIRQLRNVNLFELYNGHPLVNNLGGGSSPSVESIWDELLTSGMMIYGVASDDVHYLKRLGDRSAPTPGHGWIFVRAGSLSRSAILEAMERGDFYASTGVEFESLSFDQRNVSVKVKAEHWSKYSILFIGKGGRIYGKTAGETAAYRVRGNEGYIRVKVIESNGKVAWTQPMPVSGKRTLRRLAK